MARLAPDERAIIAAELAQIREVLQGLPDQLRAIDGGLTTMADWIDRIGAPEEIREGMLDILKARASIRMAEEVLHVVRDELLALRDWRAARASGEQQQAAFERVAQLGDYIGQLTPILQKWRDDLIALRKDERETRAALEALKETIEGLTDEATQAAGDG